VHQVEETLEVSIHAPVKGATQIVDERDDINEFQSTRP